MNISECMVELTTYDRMVLKCGGEVAFDPKSRGCAQISQEDLKVVKGKFQEKIQAFKAAPKLGLGKGIVALDEHMEEARKLVHAEGISKKIQEMIAVRKKKESGFGIFHMTLHKMVNFCNGLGWTSKAEWAQQELAIFDAARCISKLTIKTIRAFHALGKFAAHATGSLDGIKLNRYIHPEYHGPKLRLACTLLLPRHSRRVAYLEGLCERDDALPILVKLSQNARLEMSEDKNFLTMYYKALKSLEMRAVCGFTRSFLEKYPPKTLCEMAERFETKEEFKDCRLGWQCIVEALFKLGLKRGDISSLKAPEAKPFFDPIVSLLKGTARPVLLDAAEIEELKKQFEISKES